MKFNTFFQHFQKNSFRFSHEHNSFCLFFFYFTPHGTYWSLLKTCYHASAELKLWCGSNYSPKNKEEKREEVLNMIHLLYTFFNSENYLSNVCWCLFIGFFNTTEQKKQVECEGKNKRRLLGNKRRCVDSENENFKTTFFFSFFGIEFW